MDNRSTRACRECSVGLDPNGSPRQLFCSGPCRSRWHALRRYRDPLLRSEQERVRRVAAGEATHGTLLEVPCLECRQPLSFVVKSGRYRRLCSTACKQRRRRRLELEQKYGISLEEYEARLAKQDGRCAICHGPLLTRPQDRFAAVDHCHQSSAVRGLLCHRCNLAIGQFGDDLDRLRAAIRYLEEGGLHARQ